MHLIIAVLWLAASSAWSSSLTNLKWATSFETLVKENGHICTNTQTCKPNYEPSYGKLDISIVSQFKIEVLFLIFLLVIHAYSSNNIETINFI